MVRGVGGDFSQTGN